jgi:hypothetical protein
MQPDPASLEDIRLEVTKRRLEEARAIARESIERLEQIAREIKQERSYERRL